MRRTATTATTAMTAMVVMVATALAGSLLLVGSATGSGAAAKPPVKLRGAVNVRGVETAKGSVDVSLDALAFSPTFVKARRGATVVLQLANDDGVPHTFTSEVLGVDEELAPGDSTEVTVEVPTKAGAYAFYCRLHRAAGMQGAVFTKLGARVVATASSPGTAGTAPSTTPTTTPGSGSPSAGIPGY